MNLVTWGLLAVLVVIMGLAGWRYVARRPYGISAVLRRLPAEGIHGWRHGILRYEGDVLKYYKLRSLSPTRDYAFDRTQTEFLGYRPFSPGEEYILTEGTVILRIKSHGVDWEFALDQRASTALISWIESAPNSRQVRADVRQLRERAYRNRSS